MILGGVSDEKLTKRQFTAIGAVAVLIIGGVSFALVKHNETGGVKTNTSSLKSSSKKEMTSKTSEIKEVRKVQAANHQVAVKKKQLKVS